MKFRWDRVQSHMRKGHLIYEEIRKYFTIYDKADPSEFPFMYIWKILFSFLSVNPLEYKYGAKGLHKKYGTSLNSTKL